MAFDIDKMKADGVSSHLIELASMNQETFLLLIARRLEHDKLFQQFLASNVGSIEGMYPYAVAAGLMSEEDRKWLIDEENPYKEEDEEVWYTGTLGECDGAGQAVATLSETSKAQTADFITNYNDYSISINGTPLVFITDGGTALIFADSTDESLVTKVLQVTEPYPPQEGIAVAATTIKCPTDITTVEVTVAHK